MVSKMPKIFKRLTCWHDYRPTKPTDKEYCRGLLICIHCGKKKFVEYINPYNELFS